jgi:predicted SAM-dependent methyltransferase
MGVKHHAKHGDMTVKLNPHSDRANLGCGKTYHPDWDNFDLIPADDSIRSLDLLNKLPFKDNSYSFCYSSHVLEHMPRSYALIFLREIHRILRTGGAIRIVVPDLEGAVRRYLTELEEAKSGDISALARHQWMTIELLDQLTRSFSGGFMGRLWYSRPLLSRSLIEERFGNEARQWLKKSDQDFLNGEVPMIPEQIYDIGIPVPEDEVVFRNKGETHRWMYDHISLKELLKQAGFSDIKVCNATESLIPDFSSHHLDTDEEGRVRKPDSLFMESVK